MSLLHNRPIAHLTYFEKYPPKQNLPTGLIHMYVYPVYAVSFVVAIYNHRCMDVHTYVRMLKHAHTHLVLHLVHKSLKLQLRVRLLLSVPQFHGVPDVPQVLHVQFVLEYHTISTQKRRRISHKKHVLIRRHKYVCMYVCTLV